jgi:YidC/Oxa1 family membrane protein insertase
MIPILVWIVKQCHSYGLAIVLLTVLVRILVYPLVASSTRSMQRMTKVQPLLKAIQEKYKNDPEQFQKKAMEFYQKNKINPTGGCLPMLVQLPILFALFATFSGPPFGDKAIPVKVKVVAKADASQVTKAEVSSANSPYVTRDGKLSKLVMFPGDSTVTAGESLDFGVRAVDGTMPPDLRPTWRLKGNKNDLHGASIDDGGHAVFPEPGEVVVEAVIPGIAKNEPFGFIQSLGKSVQGTALLKPENWDNLIMIILFGATMFLSQKLMVQTPPPADTTDPAALEQMKIQQDTQKFMPIAVTGMFFFMPLQSGVFLYMVVSNVIQSLQTWWIMRTPAPELINVLVDGDAGGGGGTIDLKTGDFKVGEEGQQQKASPKKKTKKKK